MEYILDRDGKGLFLFSKEEGRVSAGAILGDYWASIMDEFLKAKAITDYRAEKKLALSDDQETRARYADVIQRLESLRQPYFHRNFLRNIEPRWVDQLSAPELLQAYEQRNMNLAAQLYLGLERQLEIR